MSFLHSLFATDNMYSITFFCEFNQQQLEEKLVPIGYKMVNNQLIYALDGDSKKMIIRSFQRNSEGNFGYILSYSEDYEALAKLLQYTFSLIPIQIVNCELKIMNGKNQQQNIAIANTIHGLKTGSMIGIYDYSDIGVLCMPDGSIIYQQRLKNPSLNVIRKHLIYFNEAAELFKPENAGLFNDSFSF